ncbi:uncharacterized protein LOC129765969 [Toxorhynchites rutilus septentrionalis]|uniref:uncharacterized protein LOC129765969 n=1 Tax=Toxorhynchites rutilus septentrionalis TaxID=329112 RepID=UPI002478B1CC|nr:uncharacterized protein LOC129765969 [Toxorhynchites rutilus septentrionalis]
MIQNGKGLNDKQHQQSRDKKTVCDVKRKINTLRSNYRKELKRIEDSKRSGTGADDVYSPSSWVFHALQFLSKFEQPVDLGNTQSRSSIVPPLEPMPKRARNIGPIARQNDLLLKACAYLDDSSRSNDQTEIPAIAKAWGEKLLQLRPHQRHFAEKAINDILFEACQGTLHRNSVTINDGFSGQGLVASSPVSSVDNTYETLLQQQESNSGIYDPLAPNSNSE